jgi:hypothetical protein
VRDGLLDFSVYPDFSKPDLIRNFAEVMDGGYSGDWKAQHYQARFMKVKSTRNGKSEPRKLAERCSLDCSANGLFFLSGDQSSENIEISLEQVWD